MNDYTYVISTPLGLLRQLIATQSFSTQEGKTVDILEEACRLKTLSKSVKRDFTKPREILKVTIGNWRLSTPGTQILDS